MVGQNQQNSARFERFMLLDLFRLPFAQLQSLSGTGKKLEETPWVGYDKFVGAVSDSINAFFSNDFVTEFIAESFTQFLQFQRFNRALAGAVFAGLLPATSLPTSKELSEVRKELAELRSEIRSGQTAVGPRDLHHLSSAREPHLESAPASRNPLRDRTPAAA